MTKNEKQSKITILDGGMGRELERMGAPFSQPLWSAQALIEDWKSVYWAHHNFIKAGAEIITTNSYALVPYHMGQDLYQEKHKELLDLAAGLACRAADDYEMWDIQVVGCIPPVFGSYKPDLFDAEKAPELLEPFFTIQAPWCNFWLAETISSLEEAQMIAKMHREHGQGKSLWMSLTLSEVHEDPEQSLLRSRENLSEVLPQIFDECAPEALLINCCAIEDVLPAIKRIREALPSSSAIKIGAYANAFTNIPKPREATITSDLRQDVTPEFYLGYAKQWAEAGATIIGGCCGIGPEHIKVLRDYFYKAGE